MIAELGLAALWLAAGLAALQLLLSIPTVRGSVDGAGTIRAVAVLQGILTLTAFAALLVVFARTDLSVALVFENSHSAKPFIYKVAGAWGSSSRRLWERSIPPTNATSRDGSSRWRMTKSFW